MKPGAEEALVGDARSLGANRWEDWRKGSRHHEHTHLWATLAQVRPRCAYDTLYKGWEFHKARHTCEYHYKAIPCQKGSHLRTPLTTKWKEITSHTNWCWQRMLVLPLKSHSIARISVFTIRQWIRKSKEKQPRKMGKVWGKDFL